MAPQTQPLPAPHEPSETHTPSTPPSTTAPVALPPPTSPLRAPALVVAQVPGKGRGLLAARDIRAGELVEVAQTLVLSAADAARVYGTALEYYVFSWPEDDSGFAIALGHGSLFNHSYRPNVRYDKRFDTGLIEFVALRDIACGEELVINYNGNPDDQTPIWYETIDDGREPR